MIRRALGPKYDDSAEDGLIAFIGEERLKEYRDIFPLLVFLQYRAKHSTDIVNVMQEVSWGDRVIPYCSSIGKSIMHFLGSFMLYIYAWISTIGKKRAQGEKKGVAVFSNTFVNSRRYPVVRKQIDETCGFQTIVAVCDALKSGEGSIIISLLRSLKGGYGTYRPIFFCGATIEGHRLNRVVTEWCQVFMDYQSTKQFDGIKVDCLLEKLRKEYGKRLEKIGKAINNKNIEAYITVNQYNLRDVLIIHACKQIGIRTIQLEHHAMQFSRVNFSESEKMPRYAFAQEYCVWSNAEKLFHEKIFKYENIFGDTEKIAFRVVGNIEMTYQQACKITQEYPMQRRITFMTSALQDYSLDTPEQVAEVKKWRWSIFHELKVLMERQNLIVRIRYTPFREMQFRNEEIPVLKQWGFEISESVPENLMEDMCSSMAIMSTTSTVLATARILGRMTFRLEDPAVEYIRVDQKLLDISLQDISRITIEQSFAPEKLNPNDFFQVDKLLQRTTIE